MFYRGQLCELDFQILDHKQSRSPPPTKKISHQIYAIGHGMKTMKDRAIVAGVESGYRVQWWIYSNYFAASYVWQLLTNYRN